MAHQPSYPSRGFNHRPRQGDNSSAGNGRLEEPHTGGIPVSGHVPAQLAPGRSGQGLRLGSVLASAHGRAQLASGQFGEGLRPRDGSQRDTRVPRGLPVPSRSDTPRGRLLVGGPGSGEPSNMDRILDSVIKMRTTSHTGGYTSDRMPSSIAPRYEPAPTLGEGRLQGQRSRPTSIRQGFTRGFDANMRKRLGENLKEDRFTGPWMSAFKKKQKTAASEERAAANNSTPASVQDPHQGDVVKSEVDVLIPANSTGLYDIPASLPTSPTPMLESESLVVLDTPSRPEPRCPLRSNCEVNACAQRQPRSALATSSFLCAKSKTTVGEIAIEFNASDNCFRTNS
jgi:hypothetical protein